jgi:hypothetical protein
MTAAGARVAGGGGVGMVPTVLRLEAGILRLEDALDWAVVTDGTEDRPSNAAAIAKVQVLRERVIEHGAFY